MFSDGSLQWVGLNWVSTNVSNPVRPRILNIGSIFSFSTIVGRVAKVAIEAAIDDVNSDPTVPGGTQLRIAMQDSKTGGFLGIIEALWFMETDPVPQNAVIAHVISDIASELKTPMLLFTVEGPTLSPLRLPSFVRTMWSVLFWMSAMAEMVDYHGWEELIAIYVDDDHGRNRIVALGDKLAEKHCKISYKAPLVFSPRRDDVFSPSSDGIRDLLVKVALTKSHIIVLHVYDNAGLQVFDVAKGLGMFGTRYVWIASNWLSTILDTNSPLSADVISNLEGVLTLHTNTPNSELKEKFVSRWSNLIKGELANDPLGLNTFALYAYDTVWVLAHANDAFLSQGGKITFSNDSRLTSIQSDLNLDAMSIFDEGNLLIQNILKTNMTGLTGPFGFTPERNLIRPAYEIINVVGSGMRRLVIGVTILGY